MPLFQIILTAKSNAPPPSLTHLMKLCATTIISSSGVVRSIENHGIRQLPYRFKAKHADKIGERYYEHGRFVSLRFDASPQVMNGVERVLKMDEEILRYTVTRPFDHGKSVNIWKLKKNPFVNTLL